MREGAQVVAADISGAEKDTADAVGGGVLPVHCDVTNEADVEAHGARPRSTSSVASTSCCNVAGIADATMLADVTMEHYDKMMDVDLRGVLLGTKHAIRAMLESGNGGAIVNWSSLGGMNGSLFTSVYSAAKAGVISLTKSAAIEYGAQGIRANCLCPGFIYTAMSAGGENIPGMLEKAALNRGGQPEEVAEVAAFLASDRASYVSGADRPGRRRLVREARVSSPASLGEARAVRVPRTGHGRRRRRPPRRARRGREGARGRPEPHSDAGAAARRASNTSSTSGGIAELQGIERRDGDLWIGAGTTQAASRASADVAADGAAAREGDAVHRPLPDPQPRHARRIDRPRRPGRRVPGRRADARREHGGRRRRGAPHHRARATSSTASGARTWSPTSSLVGVSFPIWGGRSGFAVEEFARRHGDFAIAGATIGIELDDDDRIRRCAIGLIGLGSTPERADGRGGRAHGASDPRRRARRRWVAWPWPASPRCPPTCTAPPSTAPGRRGHGRRAPGRPPARRRAMGEVSVRLTVNGEARDATVEAARDARRLPA